MVTALAGLRNRIPRVKPWIAVAVVVAVVLVAYYGYQGFQYYTASGELDSATKSVTLLDQEGRLRGQRPLDRFQSALVDDSEAVGCLLEEWETGYTHGSTPEMEPVLSMFMSESSLDGLKEVVEARRCLQKVWQGEFSYVGFPKADPLVEKVFDTAVASGIRLESMSVAARGTFTDKQAQYKTITSDLSLSGRDHDDIFRFFQELHRTLPGTEIQDISLSGFGEEESASAQVVVVFHLVPELAPEEEEAQ